MTISSTTLRSPARENGGYACNGSVVAFAGTFPLLAEGDVRVILTDSSGNESDLVLTTDYTVSPTGGSYPCTAFTVTTVSTYASGYSITLLQNLATTQPTDYGNSGPYYPNVHETSFDRSTLQIQKMQEEVDRAIKVPASSTLDPDAIFTDFQDGTLTVNAYTSEKLLSNYATLDAAVTTIGSTECTLVIDKNDTMTAAVTIPENIHIRPVGGYTISNGTFALIANGPILDTGKQWITKGSGTVTLGAGKVNPQWFGARESASAAVNTAAFQAAIDATPIATTTVDGIITQPEASGGLIRIPAGTYNLTTVNVYEYITLQGEGRASCLIFTGGLRWKRRTSTTFEACWNVRFRDFQIRGSTGTETLFKGAPYTIDTTRDFDQLIDGEFTGLYIANAGVGIHWSGGYNGVVTHCQVHRCDIAFLMLPAFQVGDTTASPISFCDDWLFSCVEVNNCRIGAVLSHAVGNQFNCCPWAFEEEYGYVILDNTYRNNIIGGRVEACGKMGILIDGGDLRLHNGVQYKCISGTTGIADAVTEPGVGSSWQTYWEVDADQFYTTPRTWAASTRYFSGNARGNTIDKVNLFCGPQILHDASGGQFYGDINTQAIDLVSDNHTTITNCNNGVNTSNYTGILVRQRCEGAFIQRCQALDIMDFDRVSLHNSNLRWVASGSGTNEWYLDNGAGGDPGLTEPERLYYNGMPTFSDRVEATNGTVGSLNDHEWDYGDNDALGFTTIYFRDDTGNPDTTWPDKADGLQHKSAIFGEYLFTLGDAHEQIQNYGSRYLEMRNVKLKTAYDVNNFSTVEIDGSTNDLQLIENDTGEDHLILRSNLGQVNIRDSSYKWVLSSSGSNEYYLQSIDGKDPFIKHAPSYYLENGNVISASGVLGSLAAGEGGYGDNDSLGYNTPYVRLTDGTDPDSKASGYVAAVANWEMLNLYEANGLLHMPTNTFIATCTAGTTTRIPRDNISSEAVVIVTPRDAAAAALTGVYAYPWTNEEIRIIHSAAVGTEQFNVLIM